MGYRRLQNVPRNTINRPALNASRLIPLIKINVPARNLPYNNGMTRTFLILGSVILGLSTCDVGLQYREGTTFAQADRDDLDCDVRALKRYPVVLESYTVYKCEPDYVTCDNDGNCREVDGECEYITKQRDVNGPARFIDAQACMTRKGYTDISLPICPDSVKERVTPTITRVMPRLTEDACVILWKDGKQIVNLQRVPDSN